MYVYYIYKDHISIYIYISECVCIARYCSCDTFWNASAKTIHYPCPRPCMREPIIKKTPAHAGFNRAHCTVPTNIVPCLLLHFANKFVVWMNSELWVTCLHGFTGLRKYCSAILSLPHNNWYLTSRLAFLGQCFVWLATAMLATNWLATQSTVQSDAPHPHWHQMPVS